MRRTKVLCEKRALESIEIRGVELRPGSRVVLNPNGWLEILDRALKNKVAFVDSIEQDFEGRLFVAVIVEGLPARNGCKTRNRFFVRPDEIEPLDRPEKADEGAQHPDQGAKESAVVDAGISFEGKEKPVSMQVASASAVPREDARSAGDNTALSVLVVDSDIDSAERLAADIRVWGHEPHVAATAAGAMEFARTARPRVALVDPALPEVNGLELARRLRGRTIFVAVTLCTKRPFLYQCLKAGYVLHLSKPVDLGLLRPVLGAVRRPCAIPAEPAQPRPVG